MALAIVISVRTWRSKSRLRRPGKIKLLEQIERPGSISSAGRAMDMCCRRSWLLVDAINCRFRGPAVATRLGGASAGRARLTPLVRLYRAIGQIAREATNRRIGRLEQLVAEGTNRTPSGSVSALGPVPTDHRTGSAKANPPGSLCRP
jgi:molybdate transport system regulatory protein